MRAKRKSQAMPSTWGHRAVRYDPAMLQTSLLVSHAKINRSKISRISGVTTQTLRNWELKRTRRPQGVTMDFVLRAIGYERRIVKK